ncbi:glycosyltransferase family 2 protein [Stutzerimonas zhaodongensis]|uniref:glycosyltransferase family 2 protein n=1 Tax=Stutzerimonas zhaodongensis TaxID=1176257 RepID=UPI0039EFEF10
MLEAKAATPKVAILLCTYNGAEFLYAQLDSLMAQTHKNWVIYASDDGSSDATLGILERYQNELGEQRLVILGGPRQGFAKNFMSLVKNTDIAADYYAFSDQDDIWFTDKLARGLASLGNEPADTPALFCSRTRLINASGEVIGFSPLFAKEPSFRNALVQSLAGANTMLLNGAARALLAQTPDNVHIVSHDWLAYLLVSGCGGKVCYDPAPTLDYRQHGGNLIGSNSGFADRLVRVRKMFAGTFREWSKHNLCALSSFNQRFTQDNYVALERFKQARDSSLIGRLSLLKKAGVYRQTSLGTIGLIVAASLRRI